MDKHIFTNTPILVSNKVEINGVVYDFPNDAFKSLYTALSHKTKELEQQLNQRDELLRELYGSCVSMLEWLNAGESKVQHQCKILKKPEIKAIINKEKK